MSNIFQITQDLTELFDQIELQDGELTPELEEQLTIKQDEFRDKLANYNNVIKQLKSDLSGIKVEQDRLKRLQNSKEKLIDKLTSIMTDAIVKFGNTSDKGTKYIDFGTEKLMVRNSDAIELDDDGLKQFTSRCLDCIRWHELNTPESELTEKDIIDYSNNQVSNRSIEDSDNPPITTDYTDVDLEKMIADINFTINISDIVKKEEVRHLLNAILKYNSLVKLKPSINKTDIKKEYKNSGNIPKFATCVNHKSIINK